MCADRVTATVCLWRHWQSRCVATVCSRVDCSAGGAHRIGEDPSAQRDVAEIEEGGAEASDLAAVRLLRHLPAGTYT